MEDEKNLSLHTVSNVKRVGLYFIIYIILLQILNGRE